MRAFFCLIAVACACLGGTGPALAQAFERVYVQARSCTHQGDNSNLCYRDIVPYPAGGATGWIHPQTARDAGRVSASAGVIVREATSASGNTLCYTGSLTLEARQGEVFLDDMSLCGSGTITIISPNGKAHGDIGCVRLGAMEATYRIDVRAREIDIRIPSQCPGITIESNFTLIDPWKASTQRRDSPGDLAQQTSHFTINKAGGVTADGVATGLLVFETGTAAGQVTFSLEGTANGRVAPYFQGFTGGYDASATSILATPTPILKPDGTFGYYALALYRAPEMSPSISSTGSFDTVKAAFGSTVRTLPIEIKPPIVALAHGLWGGAGSFPSDWDTALKTYSSLPAKRIIYDGSKSFADPANMASARRQILEAIIAARSGGFIAGRVDVVAHSMGGLLGRSLLTSTATTDPYMGGGRINRIITLNTPHRGSPLAELLQANRNRTVSASACAGPVEGVLSALKPTGLTAAQALAIRTFWSRITAQTTLGDIMAALGQPIDTAVASLAPGSDAIGALPTLTDGPILTTFGTAAADNTVEEWLLSTALYCFTYNGSTPPPAGFSPLDFALSDIPQYHDLIVSVPSQRNREAGGTAFRFDLSHTAVKNNSEVRQWVICRLKREASCVVGTGSSLADTKLSAPLDIDLAGHTFVPPNPSPLVLGNARTALTTGAEAQTGIYLNPALTWAPVPDPTPLGMVWRVENGGEVQEGVFEDQNNLYYFVLFPKLNHPGFANVSVLVKFRGGYYTIVNQSFPVQSPTHLIVAPLDIESDRLWLERGEVKSINPFLATQTGRLFLGPNEFTLEVSSATPGIVEVSRPGELRALAEGEAQISIIRGDERLSLPVIVAPTYADPPTFGAGQLLAATLPSSRSISVGQTATAFATMLNTSSVAAKNCRVAPLNNEERAEITVTSTNPATNAVEGEPNATFDLAPGGAATLLLALKAKQVIPSTGYRFDFYCENGPSAPVFQGVNTLDFTASAGLTPDIIAITDTPSRDGVARIPGPDGTALVVAAAINIGIPDDIVVSAVSSGVSGLPVFVCQTDPSTAQCLAPPTAELRVLSARSVVQTFSFFVQGGGRTVPFLPQSNRLFVRFRSAESGALLGSTSVAIQTAN